MSGGAYILKIQSSVSRVLARASDLVCGRSEHKVDSFIAVTLSGNTLAQREQAFRAAESCLWATGVSTYTISPRALSVFPECQKMSHLKWRLFDLFPEADTILFFAPEVFFLRKFSFGPYEGREILFFARNVMSRRVLGDMILYRIPFEEYFSSGLMVLSRGHHQEMLVRARELFESDSSSTDNEEILLNRARVDLRLSQECFARIFEYPVEPLARPPESEAFLARMRLIPGQGLLPKAEFYASFSSAFGTSRRGPLDRKHFSRPLTMRF